MDIILCPHAHAFSNSLQAHLQRRHLELLSEFGLETRGDLFPWDVLIFFQLQEKRVFFGELILRRGRNRSYPLAAWRFPFIFASCALLSLSLSLSLQLSETSGIRSDRSVLPTRSLILEFCKRRQRGRGAMPRCWCWCWAWGNRLVDRGWRLLIVRSRMRK